MTTIICNSCNQEFEHPPKRGRKPSKCPTCKAKAQQEIEDSKSTEKPLTPQQKVDRLEMSLKAAGLHISQHRTDFE